MKLTAFGQTFALRVREILRAVDELADLARASRDPFLARLRIGIIPTIAPYLLPAIINDLNRTFEGIELQVRETQTAKLVQELAQGEPGSGDRRPARLRTVPHRAQIVRGGVRAGPAARGRGQAGARTRSAPRNAPASPGGRTLFPRSGPVVLQDRNDAPREVMEGSSLSTLVQMVSAGIGITLIPEMAVPVETRSAQVSISRFHTPQPSRTIGMIWRNSTPLVTQAPADFRGGSRVGRDHARAVRHAPLRPPPSVSGVPPRGMRNLRGGVKYLILVEIKSEWCPEEDSNLHTLSGTST